MKFKKKNVSLELSRMKIEKGYNAQKKIYKLDIITQAGST